MWRLCVLCLAFLGARGVAGIEFTSTPDNSSVELGATLTLACTVANRVGESVSWKKDGASVTIDLTHYIMLTDYNLTIINATTSDAGEYTCDATTISAQANLTVVDLPDNVTVYWSTSPEDGTTANLTCRAANAYPPPSLSWYRDGVALTSATVYTQETTDSSGYGDAYSTVEVAVKASDVGNVYRCTADYPGWTAAMESNITLVLSSIAFDIAPSNSSVQLGSDVTLGCTVTGRNNDEPVTWYKDSQALTLDGQHYQQLSDFNLTIANATNDDAGLYTCDVSTMTADAYLTVADLPDNLTVYWETSHGAGSTANLTCHASSASPPPSLSWYRDDVALTSPTTYTYQTTSSSGYGDSYSTLEISLTGSDEGTRFTCSADYPGWTGALQTTLTTTLSGAQHIQAGVLGLILSVALAALQH